MNKTHSLKSKLSLTISLVVLVTVATISLLANFFLKGQFVTYIADSQLAEKEAIAENLSYMFSEEAVGAVSEGRRGMHGGREEAGSGWDTQEVQLLGTSALYQGYMINVLDSSGHSVWDARQREGQRCHQLMEDTSRRMKGFKGAGNGEFTTINYPIMQQDAQVGVVEISNYGPFFLKSVDFEFLDSFNRILLGVAGLSLLIAVAVGIFLAGRTTNPILTTVEAAGQMAAGNYGVRIKESSNTRELEQLRVSVNHLAQSLEQQENLRKELTSNVAHELRTPLTTLATHIEAMVEGVWEPTTQRLQCVYEELEGMTLLVKDLEHLAMVDRDNTQLKKEPVHLKELVQKGLLSYEWALSEKEITPFVQGEDVVIQVDPDRFYQVLLNLLSNAVKYNKVGGAITISWLQSPQTTRLQVTDTGMGIPEEDLPLIFERFYRADKSRNRNTGGSGIGMAVVKSIVQNHGGQISVASKLGEGTVFTIDLPK